MQSNVGAVLSSSQSRGNLYVVAVRDDGSMQMFWRSGGGDNTTSPWKAGEVFGTGIPANAHPVMIQDFWRTDSEAAAGGFQLLVAVGGHVEHWQRTNTNTTVSSSIDGAGAGGWTKAGASFGSGLRNVWGLAQGSFQDKMHAAVETTDGRMAWYEYDGSWH